ncbi:hypothetical protein HDU83_007786 [Entophlyctis luteolus]|nr:hypothetical protein HDU83_007786 [Entophlyctis luteolus]
MTQLETPIRRVAVIGAGASGLPAARHLKDQGLDVTLYERNSAPGGVWKYHDSKQVSVSPNFPQPTPRSVTSAIAEVPDGVSFPHEVLLDALSNAGEAQRLHNPPNACYDSLTNNIPVQLMGLKDWRVQDGLPWSVSHREVAKYYQSFVDHFALTDNIVYNALVCETRKYGNVWKVVVQIFKEEGRKVEWISKEFDAIVVATGHYNDPYIPDIAGIKEWRSSRGDAIIHSKVYRTPETYQGKNILIIGNGVSAVDITKDLGTVSTGKIYISRRETEKSEEAGRFNKILWKTAPSASVFVAEVKQFDSQNSEIHLVDGTVLKDVDQVIVCTGYMFNFPFLRHLQGPDSGLDASEVLTVDGTWVQNLHQDIFYIPDPTLAFVGVCYHIPTTFFEFQALAISRVFAGKAFLPSVEVQRALYREKLELNGPGRDFHMLADNGGAGEERQLRQVDEIVKWLNKDGAQFGETEVTGYPSFYFDIRKKHLDEILGRADNDGADKQDASPTKPATKEKGFASFRQQLQKIPAFSIFFKKATVV